MGSLVPVVWKSLDFPSCPSRSEPQMLGRRERSKGPPAPGACGPRLSIVCPWLGRDPQPAWLEGGPGPRRGRAGGTCCGAKDLSAAVQAVRLGPGCLCPVPGAHTTHCPPSSALPVTVLCDQSRKWHLRCAVLAGWEAEGGRGRKSPEAGLTGGLRLELSCLGPQPDPRYCPWLCGRG